MVAILHTEHNCLSLLLEKIYLRCGHFFLHGQEEESEKTNNFLACKSWLNFNRKVIDFQYENFHGALFHMPNLRKIITFLLSQLLQGPGLISLNKIPADKKWSMSQTLSNCFLRSCLIVFLADCIQLLELWDLKIHFSINICSFMIFCAILWFARLMQWPRNGGHFQRSDDEIMEMIRWWPKKMLVSTYQLRKKVFPESRGGIQTKTSAATTTLKSQISVWQKEPFMNSKSGLNCMFSWITADSRSTHLLHSASSFVLC